MNELVLLGNVLTGLAWFPILFLMLDRWEADDFSPTTLFLATLGNLILLLAAYRSSSYLLIIFTLWTAFNWCFIGYVYLSNKIFPKSN